MHSHKLPLAIFFGEGGTHVWTLHFTHPGLGWSNGLAHRPNLNIERMRFEPNRNWDRLTLESRLVPLGRFYKAYKRPQQQQQQQAAFSSWLEIQTRIFFKQPEKPTYRFSYPESIILLWVPRTLFPVRLYLFYSRDSNVIN